MQTVRWIGFGILTALTRTALHLYPSSGTVTAPYPVTCKLALFGPGFQSKQVSLDGVRLSQPEGLWLDEVFPVLRESGASLYGIDLSFSCSQSRVDLGGSGCVIEFSSMSQSARYHPLCVEGGEAEPAGKGQALALSDTFNIASLVVVNCEGVAARASLCAMDGAGRSLKSAEVAIEAVSEMELDSLTEGGFYATLPVQQQSWGPVRAAGLQRADDHPAGLACFLLYRDVTTRKPVSVSIL